MREPAMKNQTGPNPTGAGTAGGGWERSESVGREFRWNGQRAQFE